MPIYEYQAANPETSCPHCLGGFETLQGIDEKPLARCPHCGKKVKKIISWCHSAVMEKPDEHVRVENKIKEFESSGMWSHAAELADKHSEKTKDTALRLRALDNYKKAGYDAGTLEKHAKLDKD